MSSNDPTSAPPVVPANPPASVRRCANCAAPLYGETCYHCGQPTRGLVRRFGTILGDFADTVFNIDSRVFRTIGPLLVKPGYLTTEYLAGRRVRYVSPVRLFVFLSVLAFLASRWAVNIAPDDGNVRIGNAGSLAAADTPAEVIKARDDALAELAKGRERAAHVPGLAEGLAEAEKEIRIEADERLAELKAESRIDAEVSAATGGNPAAAPATGAARKGDDDDGPTCSIQFAGGKPWDPVTNPLTFEWLPSAGNAKVNAWIGQACANSKAFKKNPNKLKDAFLGVLPQTLFVMLPLFALLLKVVYLFKRRLYMEHLIVALHSHAFLCLAIGLQALMSLGQEAIGPGFVGGALGFVEVVLWIWMPLYLLLTQKRVYGQGWIMTLLKFGVLGVAYFFMLVFAGMTAMLISLVSA